MGVPSGLSEEIERQSAIYKSVSLQIPPPKTIEKELFWRFSDVLKGMDLPEQGVYEVPHGTATSFGGNLTKSGKLLTPYLQSIDGKAPHEHDLFRFSGKLFFPKIYRVKGEVVTLAAGWQGAFYHWIYEVLPRLHLVEKAGYSLNTLFVEAKSSFQKQSLELMGVGSDQLINASEYAAVQAEKLIVPSIPEVPTRWACAYLRDKMLPNLQRKAKKRLYISRSDATKRRLLNEEEIWPILEARGFEKCILSSLSFREQAAAFASAEAVVGPHGAGFSHLVFCDPKTAVLEFFAPAYTHLCYWQIANCVDLEYHYIFGEGAHYPKGVNTGLDPDIEVNPNKIRAALDLMGL
ncbi:MAG: hypothetical protein S4CHLAM123_08940 [Chlamydiales bacterium]|nr:hypothetical protein [Chlamydiales bacterium]